MKTVSVTKALYSFLAIPSVRQLYVQVMVIGMFMVGLGYVKGAILNRKIFKNRGFYKRLVLSIDVFLFTTYAIISYEIDTPSPEFPKLMKLISNETISSITNTILIIIPIDFIMVWLTGLLFLTLSRELVGLGITDKPISLDVRHELSVIFFVTGTWHFVCCIWWFLWYGDDSMFNWYSVLYHSSFGAAQFSFGFFWLLMIRKEYYDLNINFSEWMATICYTILIIAVYVTRLSWYIQNAVKDIIYQKLIEYIYIHHLWHM